MPTVYIDNTPKEFTDSEFEAFAKDCKIVKAAGGLVYNTEGKLLIIFRNGKWDIPKGKVEKGESIEETALREVEEECGISNLNIVDPVPFISYHTYNHKGKNVLKPTYWYRMSCADDLALVPQTEEGITQVKWANKTFVKNEVLKNTYNSIKNLILSHCLQH
jgi:ADP-ribose pyrophosphatase YjhB (NUDIX family)